MIKCPKCSGMMYESDTFKDEDGTLVQEISCFKCPKQFFVPYGEYKAKLEQIARRKFATRT